jgi:hypothetical protein
MAKIIDITDKLSFDERPKIKVKDVEIEINDSATNFLKLASGQLSETDVYNLLFDEENRKKIDELNLNVNDWSILLETAADALVDSSEGEAQTPATT